MHKAATLEKPDEEFMVFAKSVNSQCKQHSTEWKIDQERLDTLTSLVTTAEEAYRANANFSTRNHVTAMIKKAAFIELKHFLSRFINYLEDNTSIPDEALAAMSLRPRKRTARQPLPAPDEPPVIAVTRRNDEITVYVRRKEYGHPTKGLQIKNYHGFKLRWRFEDETVWHTEISTRQRYTLHFDCHDDEIKRIIFSAAWVNPRLQPGPWSKNVSEVIG
jgi:hypothetical protein